MIEHVDMRRDMALEIHRHKAGELQKAGIDLAPHRRVGERHGVNAVAFEPVDAALFGELVHRRGIDARVDGPAHQNHRLWRMRAVLRLEQRNSADQRHRGLTDAERMQRRAIIFFRQMLHHLGEIVDVIVEIEAAIGQRHIARVAPVGDVNVIGRQKGFDRAAQQGRVMARHGRNDQQL